ncbi:MAG: FeoB-associated Cys-rich membrane protein [Paludibacter sp.]|nr:FeoB-associated Cys-rich membrane protein [Paludibacter sp.]
MQDIIVLIVGIIVFGYVGWKIYKLITRKPSAADKCGGCTGCALKEKTDCTIK